MLSQIGPRFSLHSLLSVVARPVVIAVSTCCSNAAKALIQSDYAAELSVKQLVRIWQGWNYKIGMRQEGRSRNELTRMSTACWSLAARGDTRSACMTSTCVTYSSALCEDQKQGCSRTTQYQ